MKTSLFLLGTFTAFALAVGQIGCASSTTDDFGPPGSQTPTPSGTATSPGQTPTPPSMATFTSKAEPFLTGQGCGAGGCHGGAGTGSSGHAYAVGTDPTANYNATVCAPRLSAWGSPPAGNFLSKFCTNATTAGISHQGKTATNQNCIDFYAWASEGVGTPPTCSP